MRRVVLSSTFPEILAGLIAGGGKAPGRIGFVYGTDPSAVLQDPDDSPNRGVFSEADIRAAIQNAGGNIAVSNLSAVPSTVEGADDVVVTYAASTAGVYHYLYPEDEQGFAARLDEIVGAVYIYQAMLMMPETYEIVAMVQLGSAPYDAKPSQFDLVVTLPVAIRKGA